MFAGIFSSDMIGKTTYLIESKYIRSASNEIQNEHLSLRIALTHWDDVLLHDGRQDLLDASLQDGLAEV